MGSFGKERVLRSYAGQSYYLSARFDDKMAFDRLCLLSDETIMKVAKCLKIGSRLPPARLLFERIVPTLIAELSLAKSATYGELLAAMLEVRAARAGLDRFAVYAPEEFLPKVRALTVEAAAKCHVTQAVG